MTILKEYGNCTGPFGFPMQETDARELDDLLEQHSKDSVFSYKRITKDNSFDYFIDKERADVSVISDDSIDKDKEIVDPEGLDFSAFRKNPVVTLQHAYYLPPVGKSLWQKRAKYTTLNGWKAKTQYIERPENHPADKEWVPDTIWHMIKNNYMPAKSIGFLPTKGHIPDHEEISKNPSLRSVEFIFDEARVFEYAACYIGSNDNALVEDVAKGVIKMPLDLAAALNIELKEVQKEPEKELKRKLEVKGITLEQYRSAIKSQLNNAIRDIKINTDDIIARLMGRV